MYKLTLLAVSSLALLAATSSADNLLEVHVTAKTSSNAQLMKCLGPFVVTMEIQQNDGQPTQPDCSLSTTQAGWTDPDVINDPTRYYTTTNVDAKFFMTGENCTPDKIKATLSPMLKQATCGLTADDTSVSFDIQSVKTKTLDENNDCKDCQAGNWQPCEKNADCFSNSCKTVTSPSDGTQTSRCEPSEGNAATSLAGLATAACAAIAAAAFLAF